MQKMNAQFSGKHILIVDDYAMNLDLTREMLEMMACEVDVANDGAEGVEKFKASPYDLVLMDIQMPEMDGYEAIRLIRKAEQKGRHTPIVALTANAMSGDQEKCLKAGADAYLSKPLRGQTLEETLKKFFDG